MYVIELDISYHPLLPFSPFVSLFIGISIAPQDMDPFCLLYLSVSTMYAHMSLRASYQMY